MLESVDEQEYRYERRTDSLLGSARALPSMIELAASSRMKELGKSIVDVVIKEAGGISRCLMILQS